MPANDTLPVRETPELPPPVDTDHLLTEHITTGVGATVGIIIIIILMIVGALYFWGQQLNQKPDPVPYIPGDAASQ